MDLKAVALGAGGLALSICIHESGHLLAGLFVGFRFSLFAFGPILVERRENGGMRVGWNREPAFWGGVAATTPRGSNRLAWRFAVAVAGGPMASALLSACASALLHVGGGLPAVVRMELGWLRVLSFFLFLATALPVRNGAFVTDGLRFVRLVRSGPLADRELSMLTLHSLQLGGVRPRDWDPALIKRGLDVRDGSMFEWQMHLFSYLRALDKGDVEEAGKAVDSAMALNGRVPRSVRAHSMLEAAFFEAIYRRNAIGGRTILNLVPRRGLGVLESDQLRVRAAVAIAEGEPDVARHYIDRALGILPSWATWTRTRLRELQGAAGRVDAR